MKIITPKQVEITMIKNGIKQTIINHKLVDMTDALFATAKKINATAGTELLSYRIIPAVVEMEEKDNYTECSHCKKQIDKRTAYSEVHKWHRGAGHYVDMTLYYCPACRDMHRIGGI